MKRVAALLAATLTLGVTACTVDENAVAAEVSGKDAAEAEPEPAGRPHETGRHRETAGREAARPESADSVRDAKEAAEEATRRFLDVTREAAQRIKEAGKQAAASIREPEPSPGEESN